MTAVDLTNDQARRLLEQILAGPEFVRGGLRDKLENFIRSLLEQTAPPSWKGNVAGGVFWVEALIIAVGAALMLYLLWKSSPVWQMIVRDAAAGQEPERAYIRPTPEGLLSEAEKKAAEQDFRGALRDIYLSGLLELDRRRLIAYAAAKTNSEYLRELGRSGTGPAGVFRSLADLFEYKWYGLEGCSTEDWQKGKALHAALLRGGTHG